MKSILLISILLAGVSFAEVSYAEHEANTQPTRHSSHIGDCSVQQKKRQYKNGSGNKYQGSRGEGGGGRR